MIKSENSNRLHTRHGCLAILLVAIAFLFVLPIEVSAASSVTDTLSFTGSDNMARPQIIHVNGDIYAIVYQDDNDNRGEIITVNISSSGVIADSIIETVTFESSVVTRPQIAAVDSDTFAIVYSISAGDRLRTIDISSTGDIGTASEANILNFIGGSHPQIVKVDSDTFAIVLKDTSSSNYGKVLTRDITSSGTISTPSSGETFSFDSTGGISGDPQIIELSTGHFAIVYEDASNEGEIVTVDISAAGAITQSLVDGESQWSSSIVTPEIIPIADDKYALLWQDATNPNSPLLKTTTISSTGVITESGSFPTIIDAFTIDSVAGNAPQMTAVDSDTFAIVYATSANLAFRTIDIASDGQIAAAVTETLNITNPYEDAYPQILKISSTVFAVVYSNSSDEGQLVTITIPGETTNTPKSSDGDTTAPTVGKSSTGRQVVENGFSYQSNLGGFTELDADLGLTHMDSLPVAVGGIPDAPPGEIRDDTREKLEQDGLGDVANTFDTLSDVIDEIGDFINQPPPEEQPDNVPAEQKDLTGMLDSLKENLDQSRIDPESHSNPEQATQINNLLDRIAQKIAEIESSIE